MENDPGGVGHCGVADGLVMGGSAVQALGVNLDVLDGGTGADAEVLAVFGEGDVDVNGVEALIEAGDIEEGEAEEIFQVVLYARRVE